ncbi:MAG: FAD-dependent oxidoreductase, partial [Deltaproteobacteria bacterium]|nr:FAD-dependent oxidoreductase [Deltaproteobacteria bacterium]
MLTHPISRRSFMSISAMTALAMAVDWRKIEALAAGIGPKKDYPTVVIGAGLGGLCCAAHVARQGVPVTVLEKHDIPGGYATAFERAGGKFSFEVSLEGTAIKEGAVGEMLTHLGIKDRLQWAALPDVFRIKVGDAEVLFPQRNPEAFIQELGERFPQEAAGIRGFIQEVLGIHEEIQAYGARSGFLKTLLK